MENFGLLLKNLIESTGISVSQFAKMIQFNRGWLYSVFEGAKSLPEEKFQAVVGMDCFTKYQKDSLRESYYREVYGANAINRVLFIKSAFGEKEDVVLPDDIFNFTPSKSIESVAGINQLCGVVKYMLNREIEDKNGPRIYTNFPYSFSEMDNTVFNLLNACKKKVSFDHIITFEPGRTDTYNLNNIFSSLRYVCLRHNPQCLFEMGGIDVSGNRLYPCFFLTSSCLFLFDSVTFTGLVICDETAAAAAYYYAKRIASRCKPLASFSRDEIDLKQIIAKANHQSLEISFGDAMCVGVFVDEEIADGLLRKDLPAREATIQIALNYYGQYLKASSIESPIMTVYHSQNTFEAFARTGIISDVSNRIIVPASVDVRKRILSKMLQATEAGKVNMKLVDSPMVELPKNLSIEIGKNSLCMFGKISEGTDGYLGEYLINITDGITIADFKNYADYISRNSFTLPDEYFCHFMSDLILHCSDEDMKR